MKGSSIWVNGVVAARDHSPQIQLSNDNGILAQFDAEDAIKFAMDIIKMAEATMADALLIKWADVYMGPKDKEMALKMGASLMEMFRDYRAQMEEESRKRQGNG